MNFFNSLSIRIPLALLGGFLYSLITYAITLQLSFSSELAVLAALVVFLFYLTSRFLLLFSGVDTAYYSKAQETGSTELYRNTSFYKTAQWVGKFYHYHDFVLFIFMAVLSMTFLTSLIIDWSRNRPVGETMQNLLSAFARLIMITSFLSN